MSDTEIYTPHEDAAVFDITKPVNLAQLESEIIQALGQDKITPGFTMVGPADYKSQITADNDAKLYVRPHSVDLEKVNLVIADHVPDPTWGIVPLEERYAAIKAKLLDNADAKLNPQEQSDLLRASVLQMHQANSPAPTPAPEPDSEGASV